MRKGDHGLPGLKVYIANRIAATQSLSSKFLGSFHLQSKNAAGKNVQKLKHIQDEFGSNLEVMKKFKERVHQYNMRTPLQVPAVYHDIVGEDAWEARWDALRFCDVGWRMLCNKGCGWNESHTIKYHDEHQRLAATFKVPPHHPYWLLLGKPYTAATVAAGVLSPSMAGATQVPTSASVLASLTGVIDQHITSVESAKMSSFLGELCNVLGN